MNPSINDPRNKKDNTSSTFETKADETPRREGGDDALADTNSLDSRMDEKVVVNSQREDKIVNAPSQSAAHVNGGADRVDEL